jgi:sugar O-acyltransferase (sialic acid O-acetyltransferase NeuD family)
MLIVGTGGMAKELAGVLKYHNPNNQLFFFNNIDNQVDFLWGQYRVYHSDEEVINHFKNVDDKFISCIANPLLRKRLCEKMESLGGLVESVICSRADVSYFVNFEKGIVVQTACVVASDVTIKKGAFLNANAIVGHDSTIGEYVSLGPGCRILGNVEIGDFSYIGCNSIVLPGVKIGKMVRVGIGKIVDKDLPDNTKFL